jgi:long-chain acyl-CoA synthetase
MVRRKKAYPWEKSYPKGVEWDVNINPRPLFTMLEKSAEKYPDNLCLEFEGTEYTYAETLSLVNKVAEGLQHSGVTKGSKVGLLLPNCPYFVICYYAILKVGAVVVNCSPLYSITELAHQIKDSGTTILITLDHAILYEKTSNLLRTTPLEKAIIGSLGRMLPFPKNKLFQWLKRDEIASVHYGKINIELESFFELSGEYKHVIINPLEDAAVLQYTGGTTGVPKGAILTHANLYINTLQCSMWFAGLAEGKERMMAVLPFFHVFAMTAVMNFSILNAYALLLIPKFSINNLVRDIDKKKPTIMPGVPTLFAAINNFRRLKSYDLSSLKAGVVGGAQLPLTIKNQFEQNSGCRLIEGYGLTECSPVAVANPFFGENREGSIGMPLPGTIIEIREVEGSKKLVKDGKIGEICIIGPQVMQGYWNNEKETREVLKSGRFHTGDLGYMDEDGYIYVVDRIKELIITSGFNVYPREIEEVAVIGVADEYKGQKIKAFIKLRPRNTLEKEDVAKYLESKLAKYKIPEEVEFVNELPKTMIGKISKKELKTR